MSRTNVKHIQVHLDNAAGALTELTDYVDHVAPFGLQHDEQEVTAWGDGIKNITIGHPEAPLEIGGPFDSVVHAHMVAINGVPTPLSFDIRIGLEADWQAGDPQFGISEDGTSGYVVSGYTFDSGNMTWRARLNCHGPTAPAWGTAAEV